MKLLLSALITFLSINGIYAQSYKHCQTLHGDLEFILPEGEKHLFLAPHSLISNQRQIASLNSGDKSDVTKWETFHYKKTNEHNIWSQKNLNFKSDFNKFIEVSLNDGKTHTYSLKCTKI